MYLLDYHHLRHQEELAWDRRLLREQAGSEFTSAIEPLLPVHKEEWRPDKMARFTREPWFDACVELCERYRAGTDSQRTWLRSRVDHGIAGKLGVFGLRAAILGARQHSTELARAGLTAYAIADLSGRDIRDVLMGLSLLVHCATISGSDVPALLREVAAISGAAMQILYTEWADRYPNVAAIGSMGWLQIETEDGIGFRHC